MTLAERLSFVESVLQYKFKNRQFLLQALLHKSLAEHVGISIHYERLEFLGDALIQELVSRQLYAKGNLGPGELTKLRATMVSGKHLCQIVSDRGLIQSILVMEHLRVSSDEVRGKWVADICESLLAAVFLDGGRRAFERTARKLLGPLSGLENQIQSDHKSQLQEYCLKFVKRLPKYASISVEHGFQCTVTCSGVGVGHGSGRSKKEAEQMAAGSLLENLKTQTGT